MISLFIHCSIISCSKKERPPMAEVKTVIETYHDTEVYDPYRWLEDWSNPKVREWSDAQNRYARDYLNSLQNIEKIKSRITEIKSASVTSYYSLSWKNGNLFAIKRQPPLNQPLLVVMPSPDRPEDESVVVDPNQVDPTGSTTIDWYVPSPDGSLVAVSMSRGGTEDGDVHIYKTATGEQTDVVIPRVNGGTAGGDLAWLSDGSGFYYTRYPYPGERPKEDMNFYQQVWFHKLGTELSQDRYEIGTDFPRIAEIRLQLDPETNRILLTLQDGDSGRFIHFTGGPGRDWKQITTYEDKISEAIIGAGSRLYFISNKEAPNGKVLATNLRSASLSGAKLIIPESEFSIVTSFYDKSKFVATDRYLFLTYQTGGPSEIRTYTLSGKPVDGPEIAPVSSVNELSLYNKGTLLFRVSSYVEPPTWYRFDPFNQITEKTALIQEPPVDFSDLEVVRVFTSSKDGTRIPINIIHNKNLQRDGHNPLLLTGYGGFNISRSPRFRPVNKIWFEQGGIYAVANIRGGGEFGESWHDEGRLTNKQNCFDDFAAAMKYLIDADYTSPEKLAIVGGSNGGLLMGAMITQHPELFRATVSSVGIYDMIRSELTPNGSFNIPEYGTVKDPEQFQALYAYSPYHNVEDNTAYPSVLFMTGANDPRVDPMHSRKMTARLQAATSSENPILLRTSSDTGHGGGTPLDEQIEEQTHKFAFLFHELGMGIEN